MSLIDPIRLSSNTRGELQEVVSFEALVRPPKDLVFSHSLINLRGLLLERIQSNGWVLVENVIPSNESLFSLMALIATPVRDLYEGRLIMDLKPDPKSASEQTTSYYSWNRFDLHTDLSYTPDPPDLVAVVCLRPDAERQGLSVFSDAHLALRQLNTTVVAELQKSQFVFERPPHYQVGGPVTKPIITRNRRGCWEVCVRFDKILVDSPLAVTALHAFRTAMEEIAFSFLLDSGTAYVIDNKRFVHGRNSFIPRFDDQDRHLKRIYGNLKRD